MALTGKLSNTSQLRQFFAYGHHPSCTGSQGWFNCCLMLRVGRAGHCNCTVATVQFILKGFDTFKFGSCFADLAAQRPQHASQYSDEYFFRKQAIVVPVLIESDNEGAACETQANILPRTVVAIASISSHRCKVSLNKFPFQYIKLRFSTLNFAGKSQILRFIYLKFTTSLMSHSREV